MYRGNYIKMLFSGLLLLSITGVSAEEKFDFVENKGQWPAEIHYATALPDGMLMLTDKGFYYYYASSTDTRRINELREAGKNVDSESIHQHTYRVNFAGSVNRFRFRAEEKRSYYHNYFTGKDRSQWRTAVSLFGRTVMQNVYDGIDVAVYSKGSSLKYDFLVAQGADPAQIQLSFEGVTPELDAATGNLRMKTSVNEVIEQAPYAYQLIRGREVAVKCRYLLRNGRLSFVFPEGYDHHFPLVIDPVLVFATFSGAGDFASGYFSFCTTYDAAGHLYAAGIPVRFFWAGPPAWPVTPGAFQTTWISIYEPMVCINKYNASGSGLIFSTYYGGGGPNDIPHAMIVNANEELILAGSTGSFNLPVTPGCFDSTKSGGTDIFIAHFNSACTDLIGATYMGGNLGNSINGIDINTTTGLTNQNKISPVELGLDSAGNIWAVANTSALDFPVSANALQPSFGGGNCDGVLFALNPACSQLVYGTFLGGSNTDAAYGIQFNHAGNVVVCGGTKSENFATTAAALHTLAPSGGSDWDGFVSVINPVTGALLQSTYVGTGNKDMAVKLQLDEADNVYVLGPTFGNYPISSGVYAMPGTDLFVEKLSPGLGTSLRSTRLGNLQTAATSFFPTAFLVDNCSNVYVTGLSANYEVPLANMPLTPDAFQATPANFWFCVLRPDFSDLLYATYFGRANDPANGINGDHIHTGNNRLDPHGILYHSICANSPSYPGTTAQSWSQFNQNTAGQDILSFKFRFDLSGVESGITLPPAQNDSGCVPFTVQFNSNAYLAQTYTWNFDDGSPLSNDANPVHTFTSPGVFHVSLLVHNDTTICHNDDTAYRTITVMEVNMPDITANDTLICHQLQQLQLQVQVNNPSIYNRFRWQPPTGITGPADQAAIIVDPASLPPYYTITVWDTIPGLCGLSRTDTVRVDYAPRVLDVLNGDTLVCMGTQIPVTVNGTTGYSYQWSPATGLSDPSVPDPVITATQAIVYTVTASYPGCPDTAQSLVIKVDSPSYIQFTTDRDSICTGEHIVFSPQTDSTLSALYWQFGDDSYLNAAPGMTQHAYDRDGTMPVILTSHFRACPDTSFTWPVYVYALPLVDLGSDTGLCLNGAPVFLENLQQLPGGTYHNLWSTGDTASRIKVVHPGIYSLKVSAEPLGCSTTETITVNKDCYIDIPNAFTPNGDGVNDYFFPRQLLSKKVTRFSMQVFNRWGQVVFETTRTDGRGWDGRFNGMDQPEGVYIYLIDAEIDGLHPEHYQGNVTLVR